MRENSDSRSKKAEYRQLAGSAGWLLLPMALLSVLLLVPLLAGCGGKQDDTEDRGSGRGDDVASEATQPEPEAQDAHVSSPAPSDPAIASGPAATETPSPPPAPLAAVVNGQYVLLADYEHQVTIYEHALQDRGFDLDSEDGRVEARQIRVNILDGLIDSALMRQEAERIGLVVSAEELDDQVKKDIEEGGGQAAYDEWLEATGQTPADYREMLYDLMLSDLVLEVLSEALPKKADQVHVRHIAVSDAEAAQEILSLLQQGADFAELAAERSDDYWTKDDGGDLGWFPAGIMAPELELAAFSLEENEVSDVIQVEDGYHVIQVLGREPERAVSSDIKVELELAAFEQWLDGLRAAAVIERFVDQ